jgi:hypothetical protein
MAATRDPIPYVESVELPPADEADDIRRAVQALEESLRRSQQQSGRRQRDVHVKAHGCATGELRVLPNLPDELAQGLFSRERTYEAVTRFSNAAPQPQPDFVPDGRGLAIKVLDVEGPRLESEANDAATQDFILVNHPVFFAANVKDFLRFERVLAAPQEKQLTALGEAFTAGQWNPLHWRWMEALRAAQIAGHLPAHPAQHTYYSMAPIRFGNYVAKCRAKPAGDLPGSLPDTLARLAGQANALRTMLEETLRSQQLLFEFQVQLRTSEETMPVENATIPWPESESPYRTVALLLLPRQEINAPEQQAICEQLSFNVWHALVAHRPLGGINRLRRYAYPVSVAWRKEAAESPLHGAK